jgi:D-alanyl-D-alanine carboxypeptidase
LRRRSESLSKNRSLKKKNVKNVYLLVISEKLGIDINIAEGKTDKIKAGRSQPKHMANVGNLLPNGITNILFEKRSLHFSDNTIAA